ncbi:hypothetical protein [Nitrosomonas communis]|uniref:hypothetical protein n=1 Tax=Nitrosomonas communis TaxID=44574 RepID=UPI001160ABCB|nr:hypothetical protein [Nitrosomonas communis]
MLPSIRKKLIYLDQWFFSAVCIEADKLASQHALHLFSKLQKLKQQQKIFVVTSEIHSRETAAIPEEYVENREKLWQFQNDLANGFISPNSEEVFIAQWRRILTSQESHDSFPTADIGLVNPHQFEIGVRIQPTNNWQLKLSLHQHKARLPEGVNQKMGVNQKIREVLERQLENTFNCRDVFECLSYVRALWSKDIRQGIASWRQQRDLYLLMEHIVNELEAGRIPAIPAQKELAPFYRIVKEVVQGLDEELTLKRWLEILENHSANNLCAYIRIRSALEAALLWKCRESGVIINKPSKFHTKYGLSRQNDIDHISTFVPYVDALITDEDTHNLCKLEVVADELKQFPCKIFSMENYSEFDTWLDNC